MNGETPSKPSGDAGRGLMKKLKSFDGLGMPITNVNVEAMGTQAKPGASERLVKLEHFLSGKNFIASLLVV